MNKQLKVFGTTIILAMMIFTPQAFAQDGGKGSEQIDGETKAMDAVQGMADFLSKLSSFTVTIEIEYDAVQDWGQKIEFGSKRKITVRRPDRARIEVERRDGSKNGFVFDGKYIWLYNMEEKVYAKAEKPGSLDDAIEYFTNSLDMPLPLSNLLSSKLAEILKEKIQEARYVEESTISGVKCDHIAVRGDEVDAQFWIQQGKTPLLRRLVIDYRNNIGQPQFRASFSNWKLSPRISNKSFKFTPPKGAEIIPFALERSNEATVEETEGG